MSRPRGGSITLQRRAATHRIAAAAAVLPIVASLAVGLALADLPTMTLVARPDLHPSMVEVRPQAASGRLLALAPDGRLAAGADRTALDDAGGLWIARSDGSQLQVAMRGLLAAAFSPDGSWLAVLDGEGSLWRVSSATGAASLLATGPFLGPLTVETGGRVLLLAVSSVEAPFISRLARFDTTARAAAVISDETLVYGSSLLADGSIAVTAHRPTGTVVQRVADASTSIVADLGPGAIHVSVAADGRTIAFERNGDGIFLRDVNSGRTRRVGDGERPRLSPDGQALLVDRAGTAALLARDGTVLADLAGSYAAFAACAAGC